MFSERSEKVACRLQIQLQCMDDRWYLPCLVKTMGFSSLRTKGREIALLLDNCSAHPKDVSNELTNINLFFMPPNTTSLLQPLDMGIIKTWKGYYRQLINFRIIGSLDADPSQTAAAVSKSINLLQSVNYAADAWEKISPSQFPTASRRQGLL